MDNANYNLADLFTRFTANFIDFLIGSLTFIIVLVFHPKNQFLSYFVPLITLVIAIQINMLLKRGQTIGKFFLKIKIVDFREIEIQLSVYRLLVVRTLFYWALQIIPLFGLANAITAFSRKDKRAIHDLMAGTIVICVPDK